MTRERAGLTVEAARRALARRFESAAIESAELDARMLVGNALSLNLTGLIAQATRPITAAEEAKIDIAISNSFGFGGTNGTLAFRRI